MYEHERIKVIPTWMPVKDVEDNEEKKKLQLHLEFTALNLYSCS